MTAKTWKDYPFRFAPDGELSNEEITLLLHYLFGVKGFSQEFVDNLPETLQKHFRMSENPNIKPRMENASN